MENLEILKLIETVDPSDKDKLDEIDARVWCWLYGHIFHRVDYSGLIKSCFYTRKNEIEENWHHMGYIRGYSRERDILKKIRPIIEHVSFTSKEDFKWNQETKEYIRDYYFYFTHGTKMIAQSPYLPTEELAELHAIIQVITYERSSQCTDT